MKRSLLILSSFLFSFTIARTQKETDHWFFGINAGLDFTAGAPVFQSGGGYSIPEGSASISTPGGTLLFYTDGSQVWNANHQVMSNGTDLWGNISSTQSSIIVPGFTNANEYYIFTTAADGDTTGLRYSVVDMSLNGGLGDVTATKNVLLLNSVTEKLCAIRSLAGDYYWILAHAANSDAFYAYKFNASGIQAPVISHSGSVHTDSVIQNNYGQMKLNMCGDMLAAAIGYQNTVEYFDFSMSTGVVSNPRSMPMLDHVYGIEFSPNSQFLYVTCYDDNGSLLQYDVTLPTLPDVINSKTVLSGIELYGLQLGSDGKIYSAHSFSSSFIGVVNSPNSSSGLCDFVEYAINLDTAFMGNTSGLSLPGFVQTYFKNALKVSCDGEVHLGMEEPMNETIHIYPNPSAEQFTINLSGLGGITEITITDCSGKILSAEQTAESIYTFGNQLPAGVYFVQVSNSQRSGTYKVVRN